jgi:type I protein arginine methyltransferase
MTVGLLLFFSPHVTRVGFDLSAMAAEVYDDAIVDVVGEESLITNTVTVKVRSVPQTLTHLRNHSNTFRISLSEP